MRINLFHALPLVVAGLSPLPFSAFAHEPGLSSAMVTVENGKAEVVLTFSSGEIDALTLSLQTGAEGEMRGLANGVMTISGHTPSSMRKDLTIDGDVVFHLEYTGLPQGAFTIEAPLLSSFVPGHRQYLIVRDGGKHLLLRRFLTPDDSSVTVEDSPD